jgi:hypothetical protein
MDRSGGYEEYAFVAEFYDYVVPYTLSISNISLNGAKSRRLRCLMVEGWFDGIEPYREICSIRFKIKSRSTTLHILTVMRSGWCIVFRCGICSDSRRNTYWHEPGSK